MLVAVVTYAFLYLCGLFFVLSVWFDCRLCFWFVILACVFLLFVSVAVYGCLLLVGVCVCCLFARCYCFMLFGVLFVCLFVAFCRFCLMRS